MGPDNQYDPQVYKRLELVRKQFQNSAAEKKKPEPVERKPGFFARNKARLPRIIAYVILAALVLAVIGVSVAGAISSP